MQDTLPIHFAPLQGYTEAFYRNAHAKYFGGVDTYYTPFVRLERGDPRRRDVRGIEPEENKVPHLIPQLIASSAEKAEVILSLFIEKGYREADINLGCPFPLLARRHQWLRHPSLSRRGESIAQHCHPISANQLLRQNGDWDGNSRTNAWLWLLY